MSQTHLELVSPPGGADALPEEPGRDVLLGRIASVTLHVGLLLLMVLPWWRQSAPAGKDGVASQVLAISVSIMATGDPTGASGTPKVTGQPAELLDALPTITAEAADTQPLIAEPSATHLVTAEAEMRPVETMDLALDETALPLPPPSPPPLARPAKPPPPMPAPRAAAAIPTPLLAASRVAVAAPQAARPSPAMQDHGSAGTGQGTMAPAAQGQGQNAASNASQTDSSLVVTNPRYRRPPRPAEYPSRAVDLGQTGSVIVRALVSPQGETLSMRVHRSSGSGLLDQAALAAAKGWEFQPAVVNGLQVHAWVEVQVHFRLN